MAKGETAVLNLVWLLLVAGGVVVAGWKGEVQVITQASMTSAKVAVETVLGLLGMMALWLGIMRIAQEAGLIDLLARVLRPLVRVLFPTVPGNHPAVGAMVMNMSANMLGMGNAATPLGLKAMQQLQSLNREPEVATDAMCTFLVLNTSSITLVPATVIALRATSGSANPADIVGSTILATVFSTAVALAADRLLRKPAVGKRQGGGRPWSS